MAATTSSLDTRFIDIFGTHSKYLNTSPRDLPAPGVCFVRLELRNAVLPPREPGARCASLITWQAVWGRSTRHTIARPTSHIGASPESASLPKPHGRRHQNGAFGRPVVSYNSTSTAQLSAVSPAST